MLANEKDEDAMKNFDHFCHLYLFSGPVEHTLPKYSSQFVYPASKKLRTLGQMHANKRTDGVIYSLPSVEAGH